MKVVVGSGWWSAEEPHPWTIGDVLTSRPAFFQLWLRQVRRCIKPDRIIVTDSCAPLKPEIPADPDFVWLSLDENYGHPNDLRTGRIKTKLSGSTRAVVNGAMHAYLCDADYYVYVEQDCLVRGEDFLAHAIGTSEAEIFIGARTKGGVGLEGNIAAEMHQESVLIVAYSGLERFITATLNAPDTDGEISPESKRARDLKPFDILKVPYGRSRPIDFSRSHFYAQHFTELELKKFLQLEGIEDTISENFATKKSQ